MTRAITKATSNTRRGNRLWLVLAFISGMVFTIVLVQTVAAVPTVTGGSDHGPVVPASDGDHDSLTPGIIPDSGYLVYPGQYGLVHACPGREAMITG
jgi:hypothetical protein